MVEIVVTHLAGGTIDLFRPDLGNTLKKFEQTRRLMDDDIVELELETANHIEFAIGDWITVYNRVYTLNRLPQVQKTGARRFTYRLQFEGKQYDLLKVQLFNVDGFYTDEVLDSVSNAFTTDFSLIGTLQDFTDLIVDNANRVFGTGVWSVGTCQTTEVKNLTFSGHDCLGALQKVCEDFGKEFDVVPNLSEEGKYVINLADEGGIGDNLGTTYGAFTYGITGGIYEIKREAVNNEDLLTRLYAYGSEKNLPSNYRGYSRRLKMPGTQLSFIEQSAKIATYGLIERTKIFEDIYPTFEGEVSSLGTNVNVFSDSSMDFNLFASTMSGYTYLQPGVAAKVHFNTGKLSGYEFEVSNYDDATKTFTLVPYTDERGLTVPHPTNSGFQIATGDTYVILDIYLPQAYVDAAELRLEVEATAHYNKYCQPIVKYEVEMDNFYIGTTFAGETDENYFSPGDTVHIEDTDIGVDKDIRVVGFTRDLTYPTKYKLTLDDLPRRSLTRKVLNSLSAINTGMMVAGWFQPEKRRANAIIQRTKQARMQTSSTPSGGMAITITDINGDPAAEINEAGVGVTVTQEGGHGGLTISKETGGQVFSVAIQDNQIFIDYNDGEQKFMVEVVPEGFLSVTLVGLPTADDIGSLGHGVMYRDPEGILKTTD